MSTFARKTTVKSVSVGATERFKHVKILFMVMNADVGSKLNSLGGGKFDFIGMGGYSVEICEG